MFVGLNAHPVSSGRNAGSDAVAPSVDEGPAAGDGNIVSTIGGSSADFPKPAAPFAPVRMGGHVQPPKLVTSILPPYPAVAREAGIEGDVIVEASIDETGRVVTTKVISGPVMLRQAAVEALRKWKYEPSQLNGEPTKAQTTVTIRFRR
jgi:protein TonB